MSKEVCCVPGCPTTIHDGSTLHKFPNPVTDPEKFTSWIFLIGGAVATMEKTSVYNNRRVCRRHFEQVHLYPNNRLSRLAIPVLHIEGLQEQHIEQLQLVVPEQTLNVEYQMSHSIFQSFDASSALVQPLPSSSRIQPDKIPSDMQTPHQLPQCGTKHSQNLKLTRKPKGARVSLKDFKEFKIIYKKLDQLKKEKLYLKKKYNLMKKIMKLTAFDIVSKKLSPTAKLFCQMQITQSGKKKQGRRFSLDEKILALSIYKPSPKAYRLLSNMCILPTRRTLQILLSKLNLKAGVNELLFDNLKKRVDKMPDLHKYCSLIFDEMAIGPGISFSKINDRIIGFSDNGESTQKEFANHALVFMVRGIFKKYKQPIAYYFCSGSTKAVELQALITKNIEKLQETGLRVIATVCDQGTANLAAIHLLINKTKEGYIREGQEYRDSFFCVSNEKIFPIYDPPHLLKGVRNNLLSKDLKYKIKGKNCIAKWSHIVSLFNRNPGYKGVKLVPKLTAQHVLPEQIPKMRVKHCAQIFSKSVGVALGYMAECGNIEKESTETADLLLFFDDLFDSVNGSYSQIREGKLYRTAVTPVSPHQKLWNYSIPILKSMKFVVRNREKVVPSLLSWIKTIENFKEIIKFLHTKGISSLLLRNFNQDPLENFFGAIRAHGCQNIMPTATAFEAAFKTLLINNISSSHSVGFNCEKDDNVCLQSLKKLLMYPDKNYLIECDNEISSLHMNIEPIDMDKMIVSKSPVDCERSAAIAYCSGWLGHLAKKNIFKKCETCTTSLESNEVQNFHKFIKMKEFGGKKWLCYPTRAFFDFFAQVENICIEVLKENCTIKNLNNYIKLIITINLNRQFLNCQTHGADLYKYLVNKSVMFFINNWCKDVNNILTGKITFWDNNDPIKEKAHLYFIKHKGRKR